MAPTTGVGELLTAFEFGGEGHLLRGVRAISLTLIQLGEVAMSGGPSRVQPSRLSRE